MTRSIDISPIARILSGLVLPLVALALAACSRVDYEREATEIADRLYERIARAEFDGASELYSDRFFERVSQDRWYAAMRQVGEVHGPYEGHSLIHARTQSFGPVEDPGEVFTVLMYRVNYAEEEMLEQLTFSTRHQPIELVNHQLISDRMTVNFDDSGQRVRVAADRTGEDRETGEAEPVAEASVEIAVAEEEPAVDEPSLEDRIVAEIRRLTSVERNPETARYIDQLAVTGIAPRRNRIIANGRLLTEGERIGERHPVTLHEVHPRHILFRDEAGTEYEKHFLANNRR